MSSQQNAIGFAYPELVPGCTGCGACLMVCPDFCFEVYRYDHSDHSDGAEQATG
jgi:2-oxoglutarate ferredoxin oxidoreductase subunit delta